MSTKRQVEGTNGGGEQRGQSADASSQEVSRRTPAADAVANREPRRADWQQTWTRQSEGSGLARGLAWFSIGLGLAEVAAPQAIAKLVGVRGNHNKLIRAFGMREIASGVGILSQRRPTESVWSRVGGDALDLACLGAAFATPHANRGRLAAATAAVAGVTVLDVIAAQRLARDGAEEGGAVRARKSVFINRSPEELYQFWRDFQNLPRFMMHLENVVVTGDRTSHWVATAPAGMNVEWEAEITEDRPNELIAWRSLEGADVDNSGWVRFERAPGNRGTVITVQIEYTPPAGAIGAGVAKLFFEEPQQQLDDDLRRFKQVIETGEIVRSEGSPRGTGQIAQRPAQPLAPGEEQ
jgi:uncharacterized membrane protein